MDDVKPVFQIFRTSIPDGEYSRRADVVEKIHFDAQRLRADTAEDELRLAREDVGKAQRAHGVSHAKRVALQGKLTAAEQRIADLLQALTDVREALGREYWDQYAGLDETRDILDAALNQKSEGGSQ